MDWLKNKANRVVTWVKEDSLRAFCAILWIYLLVRYQAVREFILGIFKFILGMWGICIGFMLAMVVFALVAYAFMLIGTKIGVLPEDYIKNKFEQRRREHEEIKRLKEEDKIREQRRNGVER